MLLLHEDVRRNHSISYRFGSPARLEIAHQPGVEGVSGAVH